MAKSSPLFPELVIDSGAELSADRKYRYVLWRIWNKNLPLLGFILLNPSTADESKDDATVTRCVQRARETGFGGMVIVNLFAFRCTDPAELLEHSPTAMIGPGNDQHIWTQMRRCKQVICGWGRDGGYGARDAAVQALLLFADITPYALRVNADGTPGHPLYISYLTKPIPYFRTKNRGN